MYNNQYMYSPQANLDRVNNEIAQLEKIKSQLQQPIPNINQTFQITPTNYEIIRYANSIDEVQKSMVVGDTPYFSRDMSVVWIKNNKNEIKTYELNEIVPRDEKDIKIEMLQAQINEMKGIINNAKSNNEYVNESVKNEKSSNVSNNTASTNKSKKSSRPF